MDGEEQAWVDELLAVWFGAPGAPDHDQRRPLWFTVNPGFDALLHERFAARQHQAAAGAFDHWAGARDPALALVLLLDQLPRNLYRGSAAAFACDAHARGVARRALAQGFDQALPAIRRGFLYLPFEHSEALADQEVSVRLFTALADGDEKNEQLRYARRHHEIIARFGRFPHRNGALDRPTTAAEQAFLGEPDSAF